MEYENLELQRETLFKDAVLSAAEARRIEIIGQAQQEAARRLTDARHAGDAATRAAAAHALQSDGAREFSAVAAAARAAVLQKRAELADAVFADVEDRLAAFTQSEDYLPWLLAKLAQHKTHFASTAGPTLYLRPQDMPHAEALIAQLPGATARQDDGIRLGGFKVADQTHLYDETLDLLLAEERQWFFATSGLILESWEVVF